MLPPKLRIYGHWKFLTYHCLCWQLTSAVLHLLAHYIKPLRPVRDVVFTTLANPLSYIVVLTFWGVWHILGRELIFPQAVSKFYPDWLNHTTHTIPILVNIILQLLCNHKFTKNCSIITLGYMLSYAVFLYYIKGTTGHYVYRYLDTMSDLEVYIYFAVSGFFAFVCYKMGQVLNSYLHAPVSQRPAATYQSAQKSTGGGGSGGKKHK